MLPDIEPARQLSSSCTQNRLLIIAEGFEKRALSWIQFQPNQALFHVPSSASMNQRKKGNLKLCTQK